MMTHEMMIAAIENLGADASIYEFEDGTINVTLEDFEGFDDNWSEIDREYDNKEVINAFLEML